MSVDNLFKGRLETYAADARCVAPRATVTDLGDGAAECVKPSKCCIMGASGASLMKASDERRENASDAAASIGILRQPQSISGVFASASEDRPNRGLRLAIKRADFTRRRSYL